jgi:hypothetical protein
MLNWFPCRILLLNAINNTLSVSIPHLSYGTSWISLDPFLPRNEWKIRL